jgi:hypothetical protein
VPSAATTAGLGIRRRDRAGIQRAGEATPQRIREIDERVDHASIGKNAVSSAPTMGTTRPRSRYSLRISHEVSAISAQPWHAAPWSQRPSMLAVGACCAQIGSFEHSDAMRSACSR